MPVYLHKLTELTKRAQVEILMRILQMMISILSSLWVEQKEVNGTGSAVMCGLSQVQSDKILILSGDVPLISTDSLHYILNKTDENSVGVITSVVSDPHGFGRVIRDNSKMINCIIEEREASEKQKNINEINAGVYVFRRDMLQSWLMKIDNKNTKNEYYLTSVISSIVNDKVQIIYSTSTL